MLSWKTYEDQARLSVVSAVLALLASLAAGGLAFMKFDAEFFFINYNSRGPFLPLLGAGLASALALGAVAFFLGLHTAGQTRNKNTGASWLGFFLGAAAMTLAMCVGVFFFFTRNAINISG